MNVDSTIRDSDGTVSEVRHVDEDRRRLLLRRSPTWKTALEVSDGWARFDAPRANRFGLTRSWDATLPVLLWVCLNPSTAGAFEVDATVRRVARFTYEGTGWPGGPFGGFAIGNLYPWRATFPRELRGRAFNLDTMSPNDAWLVNAASTAAAVIVAWGAFDMPGHDDRVRNVLDSILRHQSPRVLALRETRDGTRTIPHHPLRLPATLSPRPFGGP